jgi:predicted MFS family arabinose efflux permease
MTDFAPAGAARRTTLLIAAAAAVMLITTGARQVSGLFVLPIMSGTGVSIASISLALAIGQFVWGAMQPVFGALADSYGAYRVVVFGALLLAAGSVLTAFAQSELALIVTMGVISAAGAAAGSFSILIGGTARRLQAHQRSTAAGAINAGGSLGQFVFAPIVQAVIGAWGWAAAMFTLAAAGLATIPLALPLRAKKAATSGEAGSAAAPDSVARLTPAGAAKSAIASASQKDAPSVAVSGAASGAIPGAASGAASATPRDASGEAPSISLREQLRVAARDPNYIYLNLGFFTCGFHVAFLVTHLPGEIQNCGLSPGVAANSLALIGLFNVAGSVGAGLLGQRYRMKHLLALIYGSRAAMIAIYLLMPKTALNLYLFAAGMGLTWLATVPPTSGIVGKLYGVRYLGTLFGVTLVSHQTGAFLGAWLGGLAMARLGSYQWIWFADMALALGAALINLPIREDKPLPRPAVAS